MSMADKTSGDGGAIGGAADAITGGDSANGVGALGVAMVTG